VFAVQFSSPASIASYMFTFMTREQCRQAYNTVTFRRLLSKKPHATLESLIVCIYWDVYAHFGRFGRAQEYILSNKHRNGDVLRPRSTSPRIKSRTDRFQTRLEGPWTCAISSRFVRIVSAQNFRYCHDGRVWSATAVRMRTGVRLANFSVLVGEFG